MSIMYLLEGSVQVFIWFGFSIDWKEEIERGEKDKWEDTAQILALSFKRKKLVWKENKAEKYAQCDKT